MQCIWALSFFKQKSISDFCIFSNALRSILAVSIHIHFMQEIKFLVTNAFIYTMEKKEEQIKHLLKGHISGQNENHDLRTEIMIFLKLIPHHHQWDFLDSDTFCSNFCCSPEAFLALYLFSVSH